jgi:hypothetical protein
MRDYEPPLSEGGTVLTVGEEPEIYPGVQGYAMEHEGLIYIPLIIGSGEGKVSEMLDRLSPRCRVVSVVSGKLFSMLRRRGWKMQAVEEKKFVVDVWEPPE